MLDYVNVYPTLRSGVFEFDLTPPQKQGPTRVPGLEHPFPVLNQPAGYGDVEEIRFFRRRRGCTST